jgi:chromosome segregation ATPase
MAGGLGEAASIAGLISLAGQTIQATSKLYTFCQTYKNINARLEQTRIEIQGLRSILQQIETITSEATASTLVSSESLANMKARITDCRTDLENWTQKVDSFGLDEAQRAKRILTKIKLSVNKAFFAMIREQLCFHRTQIDLSLGLLGV